MTRLVVLFGLGMFALIVVMVSLADDDSSSSVEDGAQVSGPGYCPSCGDEMTRGADFCPNCGHRIDDESPM